ncbi:MAG: dTDP-4-dehydrorhamnose 3,5-epimerase [Theionarchaea archaeon DG-70]|nr:MAG: dTDP-4-dehydrorhamnose 3,5-epimerase [Theionarchaea archaeon DG-70]
MEIRQGKISGIFEIILSPIEDDRGFFIRVYDKNFFSKYNLDRDWVHENHSLSIKKDTVRGLHFQFPPYIQTKLVRCIKGTMLDVWVDLRKDSPTFGRWDSVILSEDNKKMIYIPGGFAHGFCTLVDNCEVLYKTDNIYYPDAEGGIMWNDTTINIDWPTKKPILSKKDSNLPTFTKFIERYGSIDPQKASL